MTRPNRYPYTKNQWEEETTLVCFGDEVIIGNVYQNPELLEVTE